MNKIIFNNYFICNYGIFIFMVSFSSQIGVTCLFFLTILIIGNINLFIMLMMNKVLMWMMMMMKMMIVIVIVIVLLIWLIIWRFNQLFFRKLMFFIYFISIHLGLCYFRFLLFLLNYWLLFSIIIIVVLWRISNWI